jgi:hypothetical protein
MLVALEFETETGNRITVSDEVVTFKDIARFAAKLEKKVKGIRRVMPEVAVQKVTKVRIPKEA